MPVTQQFKKNEINSKEKNRTRGEVYYIYDYVVVVPYLYDAMYTIRILTNWKEMMGVSQFVSSSSILFRPSVPFQTLGQWNNTHKSQTFASAHFLYMYGSPFLQL